MAKTTAYRPSLTRADFEAALATLRRGEIPENISEVVAYIRYTTKEFYEYAAAITECAVRMGSKLEVIEKMMGGKKLADVAKAPQWVGPSAEFAPGGSVE